MYLVYIEIHVHVCMCHGAHAEMRDQLTGFAALLPPRVSTGLNAGHKCYWPALNPLSYLNSLNATISNIFIWYY